MNIAVSATNDLPAAMSKLTPDDNPGTVAAAADSTSLSEAEVRKKRKVSGVNMEFEEGEEHHRFKKLRMDGETENGEDKEAEDEETETSCSQETVNYSINENDGWLQDGYFENIVKSNSQNSTSATEEDNTINNMEEEEEEDLSPPVLTAGVPYKEALNGKLHNSAETNFCAGDNESESINTTDQISTSQGTNTDINCECDCQYSGDGEKSGRTSPGGLFQPGSHSDKRVPGKPNIKKLTSVLKDAEQIAEVLNIPDVNLVYEKVKQRRGVPNRVEIVMNEILEKGMETIQEEVVAQYKTTTLEDQLIDELMADMEQAIAILKKKNPSLVVNENDVYALLEANCQKPHRVQAVVNILTGSVVSKQQVIEIDDGADTNSERPPQGNNPDALMIDVNRVVCRFPRVDPNLVYEMLEKNISKPDRVEFVLKEVIKLSKATSGHPEDRCEIIPDEREPGPAPEEEEDQHLDPLVKDTEFVAKMFPDKDKNEIYAYLEAHYNKPNRVAIVTDELLQVGGSQNSEGPDTGKVIRPPSPTTENLSAVVGEDAGPLAQIEKDVETIRSVFPDCDPMYLYETLSMRLKNPERVEQLSAEMSETRNYPKLKERLEKQRKSKLRNQLMTMNMDVREFLKIFPDPVTHFNDVEKPVSERYKQHVKIHLENCFPMLHGRYIQEKLDDHRGHLTPTVKDLEKDALIYRRDNRRRNMHRSRRFRKHERVMQEEMPETPDEYFYRELLFCRHEQEIKDYLKRKEEEKSERLRVAREKGQLHECGCCYDDEVLFEDMLSCPNGHLFCNDCIRRSSEEIIGQAKIKFPCLEADCETEFQTPILQKVLSSKMFSNLLRKIQEEEIQKAGIEDLVACPFCSFATIMPNPDDKVFKCLNPECLKESCRLCNEPNHIPLRCEEVEKKGETDMRTYIESKMSEAMIRVCWRCKKRFYKTEGCNKMTCSCGASMCYVCRKPVKGYEHFGPNGCPQDTNVFDLHKQEMEKAADEARKIYEKEHPDAKGKELKYDPVKEMLDAYKGRKGPQQPNLFGVPQPNPLFPHGQLLHRPLFQMQALNPFQLPNGNMFGHVIAADGNDDDDDEDDDDDDEDDEEEIEPLDDEDGENDDDDDEEEGDEDDVDDVEYQNALQEYIQQGQGHQWRR